MKKRDDAAEERKRKGILTGREIFMQVSQLGKGGHGWMSHSGIDDEGTSPYLDCLLNLVLCRMSLGWFHC